MTPTDEQLRAIWRQVHGEMSAQDACDCYECEAGRWWAAIAPQVLDAAIAHFERLKITRQMLTPARVVEELMRLKLVDKPTPE